jgi:hypothetical protein
MGYAYWMKSSKFDVEFYPMSQHITGQQTGDEYIESLVVKILNIFWDRRIDSKNSIKILKEVERRINET